MQKLNLFKFAKGSTDSKKLPKIAVVPLVLSLVIGGSATLTYSEPAAASSHTSTVLAASSAKLAAGMHSANGILIRVSDGKVLMMKNINQKVYPASMTKMMTVLVALENLPNLQKKTTLPTGMFAALEKQGASMAGFKPGEKLKAIDLLHGSMLPSGAEASMGLAYAVSGSEAAFVKKMNQKAKQLGMKHTNFTNVTGLHHANHYTTVKDMSILMKAALKNPNFRKLATAQKYTVAPTNKHPKGMTVKSTLTKSAPTLNFKGGKIVGGKTGYTRAAGLCLASLAIKDGKQYILVTANADGSPWTKPYHILDALSVYSKI
ncbi:D-alanyl-D-alanine carboxypeptidase family protein [Saccharibacillus kuerlensis]|uniref:Peptidase M15 n=1 Tax=Saccharibacillus kuerlensis TaxID=459527 RepID=A0ABQ2L943_9BACL|nr:D-alanyl-D-alanine carboxypeptidase [Saccharibacillus kuerlensis]GGO07358.1 peptidase M15 [Saccharibacillus kuerlensis]